MRWKAQRQMGLPEADVLSGKMPKKTAVLSGDAGRNSIGAMESVAISSLMAKSFGILPRMLVIQTAKSFRPP